MESLMRDKPVPICIRLIPKHYSQIGYQCSRTELGAYTNSIIYFRLRIYVHSNFEA